MSFGPSATTKTAENNLGGISQVAAQNNATDTAQGSNLLNLGGSNVQSGTNYLNTILQGNNANTTATLQPSIDQIRGGVSNAITANNTLNPRSGGRAGTNYGLSFAPQSQIQNLFNTARTTAATTLPQIGLQQQGLGTNLFNIGNGALQAGTGASSNLGNIGLQQQQQTANAWQGLGQGIFGLATTPFGGGTSTQGLLGLCWVAEAIYGTHDPRTHTIRAWLNGPFGKTPVGRKIVFVYKTIGRQVAWCARRCAPLRWTLKPLFDLALRKAS